MGRGRTTTPVWRLGTTSLTFPVPRPISAGILRLTWRRASTSRGSARRLFGIGDCATEGTPPGTVVSGAGARPRGPSRRGTTSGDSGLVYDLRDGLLAGDPTQSRLQRAGSV